MRYAPFLTVRKGDMVPTILSLRGAKRRGNLPEPRRVIVLFLLRQEKYQKNAAQGGATSKSAPLVYPPAALPIRRQYSKALLIGIINHFGFHKPCSKAAGVGVRGRGCYLLGTPRPRATSLVTFLFEYKKVTFIVFPCILIKKGSPGEGDPFVYDCNYTIAAVMMAIL